MKAALYRLICTTNENMKKFEGLEFLLRKVDNTVVCHQINLDGYVTDWVFKTSEVVELKSYEKGKPYEAKKFITDHSEYVFQKAETGELTTENGKWHYESDSINGIHMVLGYESSAIMETYTQISEVFTSLDAALSYVKSEMKRINSEQEKYELSTEMTVYEAKVSEGMFMPGKEVYKYEA